MKTELLTKILRGMEDGKNLKTISKENYYSSKEISRIVSKHFGVDFITLYHAVFNQIVVHTIQSSQTLTDAALSLNMTSQNLSTYSMRHIGTTPKIIKREVHTMKDKSISEVLIILANEDKKNITLRELGVDYNYIRTLRKSGIPIISVPGRNGGYNLDRTPASVCISWVNNVRRARGITPPLKTLF